jgi:hypothetical protein
MVKGIKEKQKLLIYYFVHFIALYSYFHFTVAFVYMRAIQMKCFHWLFWAKELELLEIFLVDAEAGVPLIHHLMDPHCRNTIGCCWNHHTTLASTCSFRLNLEPFSTGVQWPSITINIQCYYGMLLHLCITIRSKYSGMLTRGSLCCTVMPLTLWTALSRTYCAQCVRMCCTITHNSSYMSLPFVQPTLRKC